MSSLMLHGKNNFTEVSKNLTRYRERERERERDLEK